MENTAEAVKSIHFLLRPLATGQSSPKYGIIWSFIPFLASGWLEQPPTTHLLGILINKKEYTTAFLWKFTRVQEINLVSLVMGSRIDVITCLVPIFSNIRFTVKAKGRGRFWNLERYFSANIRPIEKILFPCDWPINQIFVIPKNR